MQMSGARSAATLAVMCGLKAAHRDTQLVLEQSLLYMVMVPLD